jgi:hypothetical protein
MSIFNAASFWKDFRHGTAAVDGVRLHYVERLQRLAAASLAWTPADMTTPTGHHPSMT